jgi:hypothetical protein
VLTAIGRRRRTSATSVFADRKRLGWTAPRSACWVNDRPSTADGPCLEGEIMKLKQSLLALFLGFAAGQVLACYTVYDRSGRVVYNEATPPVDMSRPIHEALPARFPGAHMVFDTQADCDSIAPLSPVIASRGASPLLTDGRTARAMNVPYTVLAGGIALVQPGDARIGPGLTIIPAETFAGAPNRELSVMGNAPALSSMPPAR